MGRGVGVNRRGKGTKCTLVIERQGLPLAVTLAAAQDHDVHWAQPTLALVRAPQRRGRPRTRLPQLTADKGYDSCTLRRWLRSHGTASCIPRRAYTHRRSRGRPPLMSFETSSGCLTGRDERRRRPPSGAPFLFRFRILLSQG